MQEAKGIKMRALARQNYGGRELRVGEEFPVRDERDADDLQALRFAERVKEGSAPEKPGTYRRRDMRSEK